MGVLKRMKQITIATLNERLEQAEDPVRLIDTYLSEQGEQIRQAELLYQQCLNHAAALRHQTVTAEQLGEKRGQQALLALKAGEEQTARLALQEKMLEEEKYEKYKALYEQSKLSILELEQQLGQLRSDYQEVYGKRQYYAARLESIRLQRRMNERLNGFGAYSGTRIFERLEERVSDMEFEAKALRDVRRIGHEVLRSAGSALQETLEREMERLRIKLEQKGVN